MRLWPGVPLVSPQSSCAVPALWAFVDLGEYIALLRDSCYYF